MSWNDTNDKGAPSRRVSFKFSCLDFVRIVFEWARRLFVWIPKLFLDCGISWARLPFSPLIRSGPLCLLLLLPGAADRSD
ncbi:hypothetical protein BDZ89DRAFT_826677 [Hymenopellis radicata]|nr:hypothetical protein BDZ89DRAFT_826677 [Hymenopellis radicata]